MYIRLERDSAKIYIPHMILYLPASSSSRLASEDISSVLVVVGSSVVFEGPSPKSAM
jgi:hypothetical protein